LNSHVSTKTTLRGSKKEMKIHHHFKADREGDLNAMVVDGVSVEDLQALPFVESIRPNMVKRATEYSWGLDRIDQASLPLSLTTYAPAFAGCGVDVYIIDTGLDTTHPEFQGTGNGRTVSNIYNAYGRIKSNTDGHGHGTHCSGTVGGNTVGVAPCANLFGLKVLSDKGYGDSISTIAALDLVKQRHLSKENAKTVVSMSLGGGCDVADCSQDSTVLKVQELASYGIISAVAAGNEYADAQFSSPAAAPDATTVAASGRDDTSAWFTNYGSAVDIYAPGVDIVSSCSTKVKSCRNGGGYETMSGTSMATPHVAGIYAQQLKHFADSGVKQSWSTMADVRLLQNSILCDAVPDAVTNRPADTIGTLAQMASPSAGCLNPAETSPRPSRSPTIAPTRRPTTSPTLRPTRTPTTQTSRRPTATRTTKPTRRRKN
jgi:subtilisin family serine protease